MSEETKVPQKRLKKITTGAGRTYEQLKGCADDISKGKPLYHAMLDNGWPERQARKGRKGLPKAVFALLKKNGQTLVQLGKAMTAEDQKHLIVGRLVANVTAGEDGGSTSAKILGSQRDLNMWQSEQNAGMIVITSVAGSEVDAARLNDPD